MNAAQRCLVRLYLVFFPIRDVCKSSKSEQNLLYRNYCYQQHKINDSVNFNATNVIYLLQCSQVFDMLEKWEVQSKHTFSSIRVRHNDDKSSTGKASLWAEWPPKTGSGSKQLAIERGMQMALVLVFENIPSTWMRNSVLSVLLLYWNVVSGSSPVFITDCLEIYSLLWIIIIIFYYFNMSVLFPSFRSSVLEKGVLHVCDDLSLYAYGVICGAILI